MNEASRYTLQIKWSDEDNCYVVFSPEWTNYSGPIAEGQTYEEAARRGQNALENMVDFARERGDRLPQPLVFSSEAEAQNSEQG